MPRVRNGSAADVSAGSQSVVIALIRGMLPI
jgi:hypothetical protein